LRPAQGQIDIVYKEKASSTLYSSTLDLNLSYDDFLSRLNECIARKTKAPIALIEEMNKSYRYIWMSKATSQRKTLPRYSDFLDEEHYESLQKEVRTTSKKNKELDDMVLRFYINVQLKSANGESNGGDLDRDEPASPSRAEGRQVEALI
jgi:hypothetical protein